MYKLMLQPSVVLLSFIACLMAGCTKQGYSVIAATSTTIGVGISQQPANGTMDATLGYKRAELAFVPTNRNSGADSTASLGGGAKDTGNVIMELRYSGLSDSGIYQRLAVGDKAVAEGGATLLFAKGPDGELNADAAKALAAVRSVPEVDFDVVAAQVPLAKKFKEYDALADRVNTDKFNGAAIAAGFDNFKAFLVANKVTVEQVSAIKASLEAQGIVF